jgi:phosphoglycolate phosphatase
LVDLAVNWDRVAEDVTEAFADVGVDISGMDLWNAFDLAAEYDIRDEVAAIFEGHETEGARQSARLPLANVVDGHDVPVGVCSLNCEAAVRIALDKHGLAEHVDRVVGRDTVATRKPDPEPLLATLRPLGADPARTLFVGDSARDKETAEAAGTAFRYVEGGPNVH